MPAYVSHCKNCSRRVVVDWDGDHRLLPFPTTCTYCGHPDGYGEGDIVLVGAFEDTCPHCQDAFPAEVPVSSVDYHQPGGLSGPVALVCKDCGYKGLYDPTDITWLGWGPSMPQASARAGGHGQERA